ncbi:MAG: adenosylmethionine-8-amino-7-oxononanoate aminotransferase [Paracoccaceae bacterium]
MERVFFVSGGSEAVESAMKLARQWAVAVGQAQRWKVISRFPSYHGCTLGALAITGYTPLTAPFEPMMRPMPKIPAPRAWLDGLDPNAVATGHHYADMLETRIIEEGPETVLAFIVEPVGGASTGALPSPPGYLARVRDICDRHGILLIHDEVMSGGGRTGTFFAAEKDDVIPDIIAVSKGFAAGYAPLGAMIAHDRIVDPVLDMGGFLHGFTYAGNPLACAAGLAVIAEIEEQGLMANAASKGEALKSRLGALMQRYDFIGDVRGEGLLLAFELVSDRETRAPLPKGLNAFTRLVDIAHEEGLIIYSRRSRGGYDGDHFLIAPPMIVTDEDLEEIMSGLTRALDRFEGEIASAAQ